MIPKRILQALVFAFVLSIASLCSAITMDVTIDGNEVTVRMSAFSSSTCEGWFSVDYGDGSPVVQSPLIKYGGPPVTKTWTTTYTYSRGGDFTIRGTWIDKFAPDPTGPLIVTEKVSILFISPDELLEPSVAEEYNEVITAQGGSSPYRFRVSSGKLPTGLTLLSGGRITGEPNRLGKYRFEVEVRDARGRKGTKQYELAVGTGEATIRVTPGSQQVTRNGVLSSVVTYEYVGTAVQDRLYSSRGEFKVGGTVLGHINKGLTLNVRNGKARSSESVRVPLSVIQRAEQMNSTKITYNRYFQSKSILGRASCTLNLTAGGGAFRITRMRVFFDNNKPRIVVARSSRDISASVQINYTGTGLLKGYWEVDGRIIQRVQENVRFGKSITLTTPTVPPLPTYTEGPHRIRFVITSPDQGIPFPVAYYDVVEQEKSTRMVVVLMEPEDKARMPASGTLFSWQQREGASTYLVSFFDQESNDEGPIFSAYTKTKSYILPARAADQFFKSGKSYDWLVVGINQDGKIVSESKIRSFSVEVSE